MVIALNAREGFKDFACKAIPATVDSFSAGKR